MITLYFKEGSSDKIYHAAIEHRETGYVVNFAYGRRGSTLTTGTKTPSPVAYDAAKNIYDKLVKEKTGKGYTTGEDGVAYTVGSRNVTDIRPQLLNAVDDAEALLTDNAFYLQPKHDGKRLLIRKRGNDVTGINRRGSNAGSRRASGLPRLPCPATSSWMARPWGISSMPSIFWKWRGRASGRFPTAPGS